MSAIGSRLGNASSSSSSFCPQFFMLHQKARYGSARHKPDMVKTKPKRTPSMLALDNFDFYYAPLFGAKWPSIRLGLLTPNKFAAIINRFSQGFETNREIIASLGTINLIEELTKGKEPTKEALGLRSKLEEQVLEMHKGEERNSTHERGEERGSNRSEIIDLDLDSRLGQSIHQFLPPTRELGSTPSTAKGGRKTSEREDVQLESQSNSRKVIYDSKFKVTGLESVGVETLPVVEHIPVYPRDLQALIHPKMRTEGFPGPIRDRKNISSWWLLDGGSILPVLALDLQEEDVVFDMCAAPGGKSLMIAQTGKFAKLICNDNKLSRLGQLRRSLGMYIPDNAEISRQIIIKRKDAASVESWDDIDLYDKVLADVPCSSDRLSANQDEDNIFATDKTQFRLDLPQKQTKILVNALRSVRVGGSVVYSTCSLAPTQNEMVVENATALVREHYGIHTVERSLKKMERHLTATGLFQFSDQQQRGSLILPYILSNFGPMYVCRLQRVR